MIKRQLKLFTFPLLMLLFTLNACTKSDLTNTEGNAIRFVNGDTNKGSAVFGKDGDDQDNRDGTPDDKDIDDHNNLHKVYYASTNGSFIEDSAKSKFKFHAVKDSAKGKVHGQLDYNFKAGGFKIKGRVLNLIVTGNEAKVFGFISKVEGSVPSAYSFVQTGKKFLFRVQDNSAKGPSNPQYPDLLSDFVVYSNTTTVDPAPAYPLKGHVEVGMKH